MQLYDYVTSIFYNNKDEPLYNIYVILDFAGAITPDTFHKMFAQFVQNNPQLTTYLTMVDGRLQWTPSPKEDNPSENTSSYCTYVQTPANRFDLQTTEVTNHSITTFCKWHFTLLNDDSANKSRLIWSVSHAYCDGYKCIDMLLKGFTSKQDYIPPTSKTKIHNLFEKTYYLVIGTIALLVIHLKALLVAIYKGILNVFTSTPPPSKPTKNILIHCEPFCLNDVKALSKKYGVTVNDFLIGVVSKAFHYYHKKLKMDSTINAPDIIMPFNINDGTSLQADYIPNNLCFAYLEKCDASNSATLMEYIHKWTNMYKHSAFLTMFVQFIKGVHYIYPTSGTDFIQNIDKFSFNTFVQFTNIITPNQADIKGQITPDVVSVRVGVSPLKNTISIISTSFNGDVRFTVNCKKGVIQHRQLFRSCVAKAYRSLAQEGDDLESPV